MMVWVDTAVWIESLRIIHSGRVDGSAEGFRGVDQAGARPEEGVGIHAKDAALNCRLQPIGSPALAPQGHVIVVARRHDDQSGVLRQYAFRSEEHTSELQP